MDTSFIDVINRRAVLAPMAGVTDAPFRALCREYGCPMAFTEMVSAKGLLMAGARVTYKRLLERLPHERLGAQLFGSDPDVMAEAARVLSEGPFACIDVNMGCPAPKVASGGDGSALLKDIRQARAVAAAVVGASALPVTVKLRTGWDDAGVNYEDMARALEDAGVALITLHGRTRMQFYAGQADWDAVARAVRAVRIPVIGNGDVRSAQQYMNMLAHTGCHAVMIGRGAQGNPFIFAQCEALREGRAYSAPSAQERIGAAMRQARMLAMLKGERTAVLEMRKHVAWYVRGMEGAAALRVRINAQQTLRGLLGALEELAKL